MTHTHDNLNDAAPAPARARLQALALYILVFWSGATLMSLEMAGGKMLDSVYGSTIFVWGSIISLIMVSLAAGYFLGGRIADRMPKFGLLAAITATAGLFTILIRYIAPAYFAALPQSKYGLQAGPFIAGAVLFLIPCFLYGIVSPFAVKLSARELSGIGNVAGRLYSVSTLGSIIGTLITSFILLIYLPKSSVYMLLGFGMMGAAAIFAGLYMLGSRPASAASSSSSSTVSEPKASEISGNAPSESLPSAFALYLIVIVAGAALMALEMCGAKMLEAEYGSTLYLWGSVIGLFMGALSLGYFLGGIVSDRWPNFAVMVMICGIAGAITAFLPFLASWYLRTFEGHFGFKEGPIYGALALFTVPCVMYGMISPFAIKLRARSLSDIGKISGRMYALSTVGSILGTLLATFVLITLIGKQYLTLATGLTVIIAGLVAFFLRARALKKPLASIDRLTVGVFAVYMLGIGALAAEYDFSPPREKSYLNLFRINWYKDSPYHEISVQDKLLTERRGARDTSYFYLSRPEHIMRYLKFNKHWESGLYPWQEGRLLTCKTGDKTESYFCYDISNCVYYTDLFHLSMLYIHDPANWSKVQKEPKELKRVLFIGGGGGIGPEQFCAMYPNCTVEVAEIDPLVVYACKRFFEVRQDSRLTFHVGDGRMILEQSEGAYDMIVLDAFSSGGRIPGHLATAEFLELCKSKLRKNADNRTTGVLVSNLITGNKVDTKGERPNATRILASHTKTIYEYAHYINFKSPLFTNVMPFVKVLGWSFDENAQISRQFVTDKSSTYDPFRPDNVIVICYDATGKEPQSRREMEALCKELTYFTKGTAPEVKLDFKTLSGHANNQIRDPELKELPSLRGAEIITDDYTPTDVMVYPQEE